MAGGKWYVILDIFEGRTIVFFVSCVFYTKGHYNFITGKNLVILSSEFIVNVHCSIYSNTNIYLYSVGDT